MNAKEHTATAHLADQLKRAFEGGAWHGPAVFELLESVDAARASTRTSGVHTVWEIVVHIGVWVDAVRRRVLGDPAKIETEAETFPPVTDLSDEAWGAAKQKLRTAFEELHRTILALPDAELARLVREPDHDLHFILDGAIQHSLYHAGQIALLLKSDAEPGRELLRHTIATLAYRAEKALRAPPPGFAGLRLGPASRTPVELVGHLGDLVEWATRQADGDTSWKPASHGEWERDVERFFAALGRLDARLASPAPLGRPAGAIFQGAIADALTHVGQIALLRGHAGAPVRPESYARAEIRAGRVGRDQSEKRVEFDGDASRRAAGS